MLNRNWHFGQRAWCGAVAAQFFRRRPRESLAHVGIGVEDQVAFRRTRDGLDVFFNDGFRGIARDAAHRLELVVIPRLFREDLVGALLPGLVAEMPADAAEGAGRRIGRDQQEGIERQHRRVAGDELEILARYAGAGDRHRRSEDRLQDYLAAARRGHEKEECNSACEHNGEDAEEIALAKDTLALRVLVGIVHVSPPSVGDRKVAWP